MNWCFYLAEVHLNGNNFISMCSKILFLLYSILPSKEFVWLSIQSFLTQHRLKDDTAFSLLLKEDRSLISLPLTCRLLNKGGVSRLIN